MGIVSVHGVAKGGKGLGDGLGKERRRKGRTEDG